MLLWDVVPPLWNTGCDYILGQCWALRARGARSILVFAKDFSPDLRRRFESSGAVVTTLNYYDGLLPYYLEIRRLIRTHQVEVVNVGYLQYWSAAPWLARLAGVRRIVYTEGNSGVLRARSWKKWLLRLRARMMMRPVGRVIAVSDSIKQRLVELGIPEDRIAVVYHGVNTAKFRPDGGAREQWVKTFEVPPDELILAHVAFLSNPFKHPEVVIETLGLLARRGIAARLFMAGDGNLRPGLEKRCQELGISQRVHWLGRCDPERLLKGSDLMVLASVGEAFGMALIEALACGLPVVGSRSGAIPEIVDDGETGLLVEPLNPASFADAIERLARNEQLRRKMAVRGPEVVRRKFALDASVEKTVQIFESV